MVGQAETLPQTVAAAKKFSADILIFEAALAANPAEAVPDLLQAGAVALRVVAVTEAPDEELTLELFRRGAHGSFRARSIPNFWSNACARFRKASRGWTTGVQWVLRPIARMARGRPRHAPRSSSRPKESLIVSCVTQGMKNKEIAMRVGTTEQVVKNYLRKVYDKLGVADRLELALYCLNNRVLTGRENRRSCGPAEAGVAAGHRIPGQRLFLFRLLWQPLNHSKKLSSRSAAARIPARGQFAVCGGGPGTHRIESGRFFCLVGPRVSSFPITARRDGRVAEGARLESVFTRKVTWVRIPLSPPFLNDLAGPGLSLQALLQPRREGPFLRLSSGPVASHS